MVHGLKTMPCMLSDAVLRCRIAGRTLEGEGAEIAAEDIGRRAAQLFLEEVAKGGVVDSSNQG
jgi:hypothetical protein